MKVWQFYCLFLTTVVVAVLLFRHKISDKRDEIDDFFRDLATIKTHVKPTSAICFFGDAKPVEHLIWSRIFFFPNKIDRIQDFQRDTVLLILKEAGGQQDTMLKDKAVIWNHNANGLQYFLAVHVKNRS